LSKHGLNAATRAVVVLAGIAFFMFVGAQAFGAAPKLLPAFRTVGTAFFPEDDRAEFIMALQTPPGSNIQYTKLKAEEAARIARSLPEVTYTYATLGNGATGGVDEGNIYVRTVGKGERNRSIEELARIVRERTAKMSGATVSVFTSDFGGGFKQIQLQLRGQDVVALAQAADQVKAEVEKIPGAVDIGLSTKGLK